ncbi:electron transfer flavoprotein subunit alpha/FixB family protein [Clostridium sp. A1-XYC3]|uniref:Electron transfer flavoprotein subunit alpha/FixB family protein n=1 Tax=Clostridium tanneri TaxID=3037988 RepID=A0ABU4JVS0_9CLOT|nr:electron transfer flavoprotein subunit alpha/FixB family protein [Clostridium sp. A1-XYC3]MDW8802258.1 electron transfer flavoprotein subunit alpha/FixB family protein [Clostridium sp. A1-XYC3]
MINEYKGIWVFAEQREGKLQEVTLELLGKSRIMADKIKDKVTALLLGENVSHLSDELISYGADSVVIVEDSSLKAYQTNAYTSAIRQIVNKHKPSILLFGATTIGRDLAPRLSTRLETGLSADCIDLEIDKDGILIQTKPSFGGNIMVEIICPNRRPQMATVRPKVLGTPEKDLKRKGSKVFETVSINPTDILTTLIKSVKETTSAEKIEDASIVVAGGRGMQNKENFDKLYPLADVLGAMVGGTRPAVNEGWIGEDKQIGQSGKTISPKLMICCGIGGAVQYLVGMQTAETVIAINKDPNAAIFNYADYGIVGDCSEIIPILTEKLRSLLRK